MNWKVELSDGAAHQLRRMDKPIRNRILSYLKNRISTASDPQVFGKALTGNLGGLWRYRVGDWRIVCSIEEPRVIVLNIAHRSSVYR